MGWLRSFAPGPDAHPHRKLDWEFMKIAAPGKWAGLCWIDGCRPAAPKTRIPTHTKFPFPFTHTQIATPASPAAFVQFTAEPLAGLVDTAYLGRLGPIGTPRCRL